MATRRALLVGGLFALGVALLYVAVETAEGDFFDILGDIGGVVLAVQQRLGASGAVILLYVEESGVPLPVPGDVWVVYLGTVSAGSWARLILSWLFVIAAVVAGSTNLYLISRRYGRRLLEHPMARLLHLDARRVDQAELWLRRWGALAIIFGRHIPGFRIPITVLAGMFEVPYRTFAPSVAVSTAIWAGVWLLLAQRYGSRAVHLLTSNRSIYLAAAVAIAVVAAVVAARAWIRSGSNRSSRMRGPTAPADPLDRSRRR